MYLPASRCDAAKAFGSLKLMQADSTTTVRNLVVDWTLTKLKSLYTDGAIVGQLTWLKKILQKGVVLVEDPLATRYNSVVAIVMIV